MWRTGVSWMFGITVLTSCVTSQTVVAAHTPTVTRPTVVVARLEVVELSPALLVPAVAEPSGVAGTTAQAAPSGDTSQRAPARQYNGHREEDILRALDDADVIEATSVGNTSLNFHVDLQGPYDGGFKPSEQRHMEHYRAEVAAFRFNRLMGLERVPPAVLRKVDLDAFKKLPHEIISRAHVHRGQLRGAMIYWVPVLHPSGFNSLPWVNRWSRWLRIDGTLPDDSRSRAEDISTLIAFDHLTANWDRWNGDNSMIDAHGRIVYRDNNGAFFEHLGEHKIQVLSTWLHRVQRFSRRFIDRARTLTAEQIETEVNRDMDPRRPLLTPTQIEGILLRRDELIAYVDSLIAQSGEQAVYAFE